MKNFVRKVALSLAAAISMPALAVDIEVLNETDLSVRVQGGAAVPSASSTWIRPDARVTITKPGGSTLEYRFEDIRTGESRVSCDYRVVPWGFYVKLYEKTSGTGAERMVGQICASRTEVHADTIARLRFRIDEHGEYMMLFENRGTINEHVVGGIWSTLTPFGKSSGITSGLLRGSGDDYAFEYKDQCLGNGGGGNDLTPVRFNWGGAGLCGLGGLAVYENKQSVITLRKVDAEHYVLLSAIWRWQTRANIGGITNSYEFTGQNCLQANANGTVVRTNAGTDDLCNSRTDAEFLSRPDLLWKIKSVDGGTFITNSAYGGIEKCLMFPNNGQGLYPNVWNWGLGGEVCGLPRGQFDPKGQAGWKLTRFF